MVNLRLNEPFFSFSPSPLKKNDTKNGYDISNLIFHEGIYRMVYIIISGICVASIGKNVILFLLVYLRRVEKVRIKFNNWFTDIVFGLIVPWSKFHTSIKLLWSCLGRCRRILATSMILSRIFPVWPFISVVWANLWWGFKRLTINNT